MAKKKIARKKVAKKKVAKKKIDVDASIMAGFMRVIRRVRRQRPATRRHLKTLMMKQVRNIQKATDQEKTDQRDYRRMSRLCARLQKRVAKIK